VAQVELARPQAAHSRPRVAHNKVVRHKLAAVDNVAALRVQVRLAADNNSKVARNNKAARLLLMQPELRQQAESLALVNNALLKAEGRHLHQQPEAVAHQRHAEANLHHQVVAEHLLPAQHAQRRHKAWLHQAHRVFRQRPVTKAWLMVNAATDFSDVWIHFA